MIAIVALFYLTPTMLVVDQVLAPTTVIRHVKSTLRGNDLRLAKKKSLRSLPAISELAAQKWWWTPSNMGHYKLLSLETSIFGPGLFCIRMIGLVFFSYHRGQSPKEEEEGWWSALLPLLAQWANVVLKAAGFPV